MPLGDYQMTTNSESTKRVIVIIVEGVSDQVSFENYLNTLSKDKSIFFSVYKGDLTTDYDQDDKTVNEIIKELVESCATSENFSVNDVAMVIQLTDTDGVFAKNVIQQDLSLTAETSTMYFENKILTRDVLRLEEIHRYKRERLIDCLRLTEIEISMWHKIPYEIYYMSCNLECALYGKYNTTDEEKADLSENFSVKYSEEQIGDFIAFMNSINASGSLEFRESWDYIKKDNNSLKPCSNFIIYLLKLYTDK